MLFCHLKIIPIQKVRIENHYHEWKKIGKQLQTPR